MCILESMSFRSVTTVNRLRRYGSNVVMSSLSPALQVRHRQLISVTILLVLLAVVRAQITQAPVQAAEVIVRSTRAALARDVGKSLLVHHLATCEVPLAWQMMVWAVRHAGVQIHCQQIGWHLLLPQSSLGCHHHN